MILCAPTESSLLKAAPSYVFLSVFISFLACHGDEGTSRVSRYTAWPPTRFCRPRQAVGSVKLSTA